MSTYTTLLKQPGVSRLLVSQLTARFPQGMLSLSLIMHIQRIHHSYALAGIAVGAFSVGAAICGPLTSRWMGRWGIRPVLIVTTLICAATITVAALVVLPPLGYIVLGFLAGVSTPPIVPAVRTIYPKMVPAHQLTPLFSLDATAQELIWIVGPVLATFLAFQFSTTIAVLACTFFMLIGGVWFITTPVVRLVRIPPARHALGKVLAKPPVVLAAIIGMLLIAGCGAVEASAVSAFGHENLEAGIVLSMYSVGSIMGGITLGSRPVSNWSLAWRLVIVTIGAGLAAIVMQAWWIAAALFISGFGIAPALAIIYAVVSSSVRFSETAEAYGWVGTGQLIGGALGSAIAGVLIDSFSSQVAFISAGVFALLAMTVAMFAAPHLPDLRLRDATPIPDTVPVAVVPD